MFVRRLCAAFPLAAPAKPVTHGRNKGRVGIEERRGGKRERPDPGKPVKFQRPHKRSRHESDGCVYQQPRFPGVGKKDHPGEQVDDEQSCQGAEQQEERSTRLNSSHTVISYAVFCLKKKKKKKKTNKKRHKKKRSTK